ncbi:MAG: hypothetical protein KGO93_08455 [Cyanobacteria bacterium REEB446]|jgi:hypothetical protein|nr:hypothetical protein [Cyanobacteria bacterium REEB446]
MKNRNSSRQRSVTNPDYGLDYADSIIILFSSALMTPLGQVLLEYLKGSTIEFEITRIILCLISAMVGGFLVGLGFIIRKGERKND